jgi:hypothetical protein
MVAYFVFFLVGAVLGTFLDQLHVRAGIISYARPALFGQAVWVPLLFGGAAVGLGYLHRKIRRLMHENPSYESAALARDFALFAAAYVLSAFAPLPTWALLLLFVSGYALRVVLLRESPHRIVHAIACASIGVVWESLITDQGAFTYHHPDVLRVPFWLPGLYLHAAPFLGGLDDFAEAHTARA